MIIIGLIVLSVIVFYLGFFLMEVILRSYWLADWAEMPTIILLVVGGVFIEGFIFSLIGHLIKTGGY